MQTFVRSAQRTSKWFIGLFLMVFFIGMSGKSWGQLTLPAGTSYTQNFDGVGTALPTGWSVRTSATSTSLGTSSSFTTAPTPWITSTTGYYNYASADGLTSSASAATQAASTDRDLGVRQSGSFGNPGAAFVLQLANTSGKSSFNLSFKLQSLDVSSPRIVSWLVDYGLGTSPTTFTTITTSPVTIMTGNSAFTNTNVSLILPAAVANQSGNVWIRIVTLVASTGSGNNPTTGIDDVSLSWTNAGSATPPTLAPATGATVDAPFDITFTDDAAWRAAITGVTINGTALTAGFSASAAGKITFTPSASVPAALLQTSGSKSIVITATGYADATVTQGLGFGAATKLVIGTQPTAPLTNGAALAAQPVLNIADQYGNIVTTSTTTVVASVGTGTWTLGGTTSVAAVSGTTTFTNLTATSSAAVTGATITFAATGFTSITSTAFNIPAPIPNIVLSSPSQVAAGNIFLGTNNNVIYNFQTAITIADAAITAVTFTTSGTYGGTISNFKLYYNTINSFTGAIQIGSSITTTLGNGSHTFSSLTQNITSGTTGYFFITTDVPSTATKNSTLAVSAITTSTITFSGTTSKSGTTSAGGTQTILGLTAPALTSTTTPTSVDNNFTVTYPTDASFTSAITSITISTGSTPTTLVSGTDYTLSGNNTINFTPSASGTALLHTPGTYTITVNATNYTSPTVSQQLTVGVATKLAITTQPTAPSSNGAILAPQPVVNIADQYGNIVTTSTATVLASVGAGTWTLGGTTSKTPTSGVVTYSGLTATSAAAVTGATITFTSTGLTSATSNTFNIPAPAPSNDLCSGAQILTINGSLVGGTTVGATVSTPFTGNSDVWYKITPSSTGSVTITTTTMSQDIDLYVYNFTSCPTSTPSVVASGAISADLTNESVTFTPLAGATYYIRVVYYSTTLGSAAGTFNIQVTQPLTPPALTAATGATVDAPFDITFTDDAAWRVAITGITIGGTPLTAGFSASTGKITFTPSSSVPATLLQTSGSKSIVISATGYSDATVTQTINPGAVTQLAFKTQPTAPTTNGTALATQPAVYLKDQYGNTTTSTATVTATRTQTTWTLGGTTTVTAVSGTATFSGLTASSATAVSGATITFTSGSLAPLVSNPFNIPAPLIGYLSIVSAGTAVTENFDGMGTSLTATIPDGFKASVRTTSQGDPSWNDATYNLSATTRRGGTTGTDILMLGSAGGTYNFANGDASTAIDRGLGFITSGTYPTSTGSSNTGLSILARAKNLTGSTLSQVTVAWDYEKYLGGSSAATWTFYYSTNGSTWTAVTGGNQTYASDNTTTPYNPPLTNSKSVTIQNLNLASNSDIYFRWSDASGGTSAQAIGIDNFSINSCQLLDAQIASAPNAVCVGSGAGVKVSSVSGGTLTYTTQVSGGTGVNHTATLAANGTITLNDILGSSTVFTLVSVSSTGSCSNTVSGTATVNVNPLPVPSLTSDAFGGSSCINSNVTYTTDAGQTNYIWTVNGVSGTDYTIISGGTSSSNTETIKWLSAGSHTVSVNYTNGNGCTAAAAITLDITVNPTSVAGTISGAGTVCTGTNSTTLTLSGNTGTIQWQSSTSINGTYNDISGATGQTYTATNLTATTYYIAVVTSGSCSATTTSPATITVSPASVAGTISGGTTVCTGTNSTTLTLSGYTGTIQWQSSTSLNGTYNSITGATSATYVATNLTATTYYKAVVTSGACSSATTTMAATITVTPQPAAMISYTGTPFCTSATLGSPTQTGTAGGAYSSSAGLTIDASSGTITPSTSTAGTYTVTYTVDAAGGCAVYTTTTSVTITATPSATITYAGTPFCTSTTSGTPTQTGTAGGTYSSAAGLKIDATSGTIIPSTSTAGTYTITYTVAAAGGCGVYTTTAQVIINPLPSDNLQISAASSQLCTGTTGTTVTISGGTPGYIVYYTISNNGNEQMVTLTDNGSGSGSATITVPAPSDPGTITYKISGESNGNCRINLSGPAAIITVNQSPTVADISGPDFIAINKTGTYTDGTAGGIWSLVSSPSGSATKGDITMNPDKIIVNGISVGAATLVYTVTTNGCTTDVNKPISIFDNTIITYRTKQDGYATDPNVWSILTDNGVWVDANAYPTNNDNILVRHNLTLLLADYDGAAGRSFDITSHDTTSGLNGNGTLTVAPTHYFQSQGSVNFNGRLVVLKSSSEGTAAIGIMKTDIAGASNVQVERFTDGKPSANNTTSSRRAWRLITSPVTGQTIHQSWQEDAASNAVPNAYGTLITGYNMPNATTASAQGYDFTGASLASSIKRYDFATNAWISLPSPGTLTSLQTEPAYMLFVRGDRTIGANTNMSTTATLRSTGTLQQGTRSLTFTAGKTYVLVGNPYASAIDFGHFYSNSQSNSVLIKDQFYSWNSTIGAYGAYVLVTHDGTNGYKATPDANLSAQDKDNYKYIPNGSGFFVTPASATTAGTISFHEEDKAPGKVPPINPFRVVPNATNVKEIIVNLNLKDSDTSLTLADGFRAKFSADYEGNEEDNSSTKLYNFNENLNLVRGSYAHIIEAHGDVKQTDTLYMKMWYVTKRNYQLQILGENWASAPGVHAYLVDNYLATKQEVTLSGTVTSVNFTVNTDSASWKSDRFSIVFQNSSTVLPVTLTSVKAAAQNGGVNVTWTVSSEQNIKTYTVERSINGGNSYTAIGSQQAKNQTVAAMTNYQSFDAAPQTGSNLYRIRIETKEGVVTYSSVVTVVIGQDNGKILITLYPNPVRPNGKVSLQMSNLATGTYLVNVYSQAGQTVYQKKITISQANTTQSEELRLGSSLAQGSYEVRISNSKSEVVYADKLVVGR